MKHLLIKFWNIAYDELGEKEAAGEADNPQVLEYHKAASAHTPAAEDSVPWCAAFACWVIEQAGTKSPRSAWARDFLNWGEIIKEPMKGCIAVFDRGQGRGHVGFYSHEDDSFVYVLGGNQNDEVCVKGYKKSSLLGYRGIRAGAAS